MILRPTLVAFVLLDEKLYRIPVLDCTEWKIFKEINRTSIFVVTV